VLKRTKILSLLLRKFAISTLLVAVTVLAVASIGGGRNKAKPASLKPGFTPIKTSKGFTLKSGPSYRGSIILKESRFSNYISYKSLVTYQKGNTTFILPNKYNVSIQPNTRKSNLQMLNLRFKLCK